MNKIGVVEGFFGPAWPEVDRRGYAAFIAQTGGGFYIYAPKQDQCLRKGWRKPWTPEYVAWLTELAVHFRRHGVVFGVGLSPFGLGKELSQEDGEILAERLSVLCGAGVQLLGLFFDDMPSEPGLAATQMACLSHVKKHFAGKTVFCPSYYSFDPILEKVFGKMPEGYWEEVAMGTPADVALAWTGPKVISPVIDVAHMREVTALLRRPPFLWENIFANDGPKNCKFLKLKPFSGREGGVLGLAEACGFNMMNQAELSKIVFLSARLVIERGQDPAAAFQAALGQLCSPGLARFLETHRADYLERGLDALSQAEKEAQRAELAAFPDAAAKEVSAWLSGDYIVGSECLTD